MANFLKHVGGQFIIFIYVGKNISKNSFKLNCSHSQVSVITSSSIFKKFTPLFFQKKNPKKLDSKQDVFYLPMHSLEWKFFQIIALTINRK
jgi:hypothetical protein